MKLDVTRARVLVLGCRLIVAGVFVLAAVPKLLEPALFAQDIDNYRLLPAALVGPMAVLIPTLELVVAAALLTGLEARGAALMAAVMLFAFTVGMAQAKARGIDLACGCFGGSTEARVGWTSMARNVALLLASVVVLVSPAVPWRRAPRRQPDTGSA